MAGPGPEQFRAKPSFFERYHHGLLSYFAPLTSSGFNFSSGKSHEDEWRRDCISFIFNYNPFFFVATNEQYENLVRPKLKLISFHSFLFQSAAVLGAYYGLVCLPLTRYSSGILISSCRKHQARSFFWRTAAIPLSLFCMSWKFWKSRFDFDALNERKVAFPFKENHLFLRTLLLQEVVSRFLKKKESIQSGFPVAQLSEREAKGPLEEIIFKSAKPREEGAPKQNSELYELEALLERENYFEKSLRRTLGHMYN